MFKSILTVVCLIAVAYGQYSDASYKKPIALVYPQVVDYKSYPEVIKPEMPYGVAAIYSPSYPSPYPYKSGYAFDTPVYGGPAYHAPAYGAAKYPAVPYGASEVYQTYPFDSAPYKASSLHSPCETKKAINIAKGEITI